MVMSSRSGNVVVFKTLDECANLQSYRISDLAERRKARQYCIGEHFRSTWQSYGFKTWTRQRTFGIKNLALKMVDCVYFVARMITLILVPSR